MQALVMFAILLAATAVALENPASLLNARPAHVQTAGEMEAAIVKGIVANPEVFATGLRVDARSGAVTLRGSVKSHDAKATAEKVARAVPGVRSVENLLTVRAPERS